MDEPEQEKWGLVRPFDIDDGQLDGLTPQQCFVLGYELAQFDARLATGEEFECLIHAENRERVDAAIERESRGAALIWKEDDPSETWVDVHVRPRENQTA